MRSKIAWWSVYGLGLALCIVPPCIAVIDRFGFWDAGQKVSAAVVILLVMCCIPMWRQLKNGLKSFAENPSAWGIWLAATIVFWLFDRISSDMLVICYIALPASIIGALLMSLSHKKLKGEDDE